MGCRFLLAIPLPFRYNVRRADIIPERCASKRREDKVSAISPRMGFHPGKIHRFFAAFLKKADLSLGHTAFSAIPAEKAVCGRKENGFFRHSCRKSRARPERNRLFQSLPPKKPLSRGSFTGILHSPGRLEGKPVRYRKQRGWRKGRRPCWPARYIMEGRRKKEA